MDVMIDLETMGLRTSSVLLSLGAVAFDSKKIHGEIHLFFDTKDQEKHGRTCDVSTALWWMHQDEAARMQVLNGPTTTPQAALDAFSHWMSKFNVQGVWGNGSDFDNVLLKSFYESYGMLPPWMHSQNRCYRTVKAMFGSSLPRPLFRGTPHNALHDARNQAVHLQALLA